MIAKSHISSQTFPASRFVSADVHNCQRDLDTQRVNELLSKAFCAESAEVQVVPSGTRYRAENLVWGGSVT